MERVWVALTEIRWLKIMQKKTKPKKENLDF